MSFENLSVVDVYFSSGSEKMSVGRLTLKDRRIFFEYSPEFIKRGLELSPFYLPLKSGIQTSEGFLFEGLFGVFNDSLPDGWGRLLLDRKLIQLGINPGALSPLDRLCYVGNRGMGALEYFPAIQASEVSEHMDLDVIAEEIHAFQEEGENRYVDDLLAMNGSSAGARPKILIKVDREDWIIKFRSFIDLPDVGLIEYAYHLMAKEAGLDVPKAQLFPAKKGLGHFGVKRFDRSNGERIHMHTISGLLHVDHRLPNLDYEAIMKATAWLTKDAKECEKQFHAAVFNVLSHNRDDHAKNFSFLMDSKGVWRVSPAYDLTFSSGPSGEHCTMIMGEGKNPGLSHLLKLAAVTGINKEKAMEIIEKVKNAVSQWKYFASQVGISEVSSRMIQRNIDGIGEGFTYS